MQTPIEDLPSFTSRDSHHVPLLHLILRESEDKPIESVLHFLREFPGLEEVCTKSCAHGLRAGKCYQNQAVKLLCAAAHSERYLKIVKCLLRADTDVNVLEDDMTPLMHGVVHGRTETVATILTYKATVDVTNCQQETSLLLACRSRQWQAARILFDHGAMALHADINGQTPLHVAISNDGRELVEHMVSQQPAVFDKLEEISSLSDACKFKYDIFAKIYPSLSNKQIEEVVTQACLFKNTDVLQHIGEGLEDHVLIRHIIQAYHTDHFDCIDALLDCFEEREKLDCPVTHLSVTDSCKRKELINLTQFLIMKGGQQINENNGEPLRATAKFGNLRGAEYLIQRCHVDVDERDAQGATALWYASVENNLDVADLLLKFGAHVNVYMNETPLTAACKNGHQEIVNRLLQDNPNIEKKNKHGLTPVEVAVLSGHTTIAANLKKKGAPLHSFNVVTLFNLCQLNDLEQTKTFLEARKDLQIADEKVLNEVVKTENCKLLNLLLDSSKVSKSTEALAKALETACSIGTKAIALILMEWSGGKVWKFVKDKPEFHLYQGILHQHANIVELLLTRCDFATGPFPLEHLVRSKEILKLVLKYKIPQHMLDEALLIACSSRHRIPESCVRLLLDASADVTYHDPQTRLTPLLAAITNPSEALVRILLEYGSDPNVTDDEKNSPLYLVCDIGHHSIASLLLNNRDDESEDFQYKHIPADPNPSDLPPEKCPLWVSCLRGHLDLVTLLADNKANLNLQNEEESILQASHKAEQYEVVRLLLEYGADPATLSTVDLKTACHYGYAERAVALSHEATMDELKVCVSEACNEGFPETGMAVVINIPDEDQQKELAQVLHQRHPGPQPQSENDTTDSEPLDDNLLWKYFYSKKSEEMMELIKEGYNPNITNIHGTTLLQACLQEKRIHVVRELCPLVDVNQKDSVGRNILFYVLTCLRGRPEQGELFHLFVERGADMTIQDDFGRTLLHVWDPQPASQTQSAPDISLGDFTQHIDIDEWDFKKQTPLHAAVLQKNPLKVRQLLNAGSAPTIIDGNKISPFKLSKKNPDVYQLFIDVDPELECVESIIPPVFDVHSASFSNAYSLSHRIPAGLNKLFYKTNVHSSLHNFREIYEGPLFISKNTTFKREFKEFCNNVCQFMEDVSNKIKSEDPLFSFQPTLSGSCSEATKVVTLDKAVVLCMLSHPDWKEFEVLNLEENDCAFMKLSSDSFAEKHPKLVRKSCLSVHRVFARFYSLVRKSVAEAVKKYKNLYVMDSHCILESTYCTSSVKLAWAGRVLPFQEFRLDVVPAVPMAKDKIPRELNHYDLLHDIFAVPKWTASLIDTPYSDEAFQLGFSFSEKDLFLAVPIELREGYMLTKVLAQMCMVIDSRPIDLYISSYMLKCKMFEVISETRDFAQKMKELRKRDLIDDELQPPRTILTCGDQILKKLEESIKNRYQEDFFLKGCNLLSHSMYTEDFRPLLYVRLCRAMMQSPSDHVSSWDHLAQVVVEQLVKEENFQRESFIDEIRTMRKMGLTADWKSENGTCLLYYMMKHGLVDGVKMLVEWGVTSDNIDGDGRSFIEATEYFEQPAILNVLLEKGNS